MEGGLIILSWKRFDISFKKLIKNRTFH